MSIETNDTKKKSQPAFKQGFLTEKRHSLYEVVSGIAHEINNPLTGILGYINLLEVQPNVSTDVTEKLTEIKKQALRIKDIVDELQQLNPEKGTLKFEIDLCNLLEKLIKIMIVKHTNIQIILNNPSHLTTLIVFGNHFTLWQVFEEIIDNAVEAIRADRNSQGNITINLRQNSDKTTAILEFVDNGCGFENLHRAFDPFYTTKSRTEKKGIGLSKAYNLIKEHQGKIQIRNNAKGATVKISIPLYYKNNLTLEEKDVKKNAK